MFQIPLINTPQQTLTVELPSSTGTTQCDLVVTWSDLIGLFSLDIYDSASQTPFLQGLTMCLGQGDMLKPYALDLGGLLLLNSTGTDTEPNLTTLGVSSFLYSLSPAEAAQLAAAGG